MDCACGHPIFQKADRAIIQYRRETYYVHTGCMGKFFVEHPSGTCVPTREFLEITNARKAKEARERATEREKTERVLEED